MFANLLSRSVGSLGLFAFLLARYVHTGVYSHVTILLIRPMQRLYELSGRPVKLTPLTASSSSFFYCFPILRVKSIAVTISLIFHVHFY